jgi:hypothetical protein
MNQWGSLHMMPMRLLAVWLAFLVFAAPGWAETDAKSAESLMHKSGLWAQLAEIAPEVRASMMNGISRSGRKPTEAEKARLLRAVDHAYSADRLRAACLAVIARDLQKAHLAALLQWYDGASGRRITRLEQAQATQHGQTALGGASRLLQEMPSARRRTLEELVVVTRAAELQTELSIGTLLASQQAAASASPGAPHPSISDIKEALDKQRQGMTRMFSALSLATFAVTYSPLSAAELEGYVDFLKSEPGRHYNLVTMRAFGTAMLDAAAELGRTASGSKDQAHT